MSGGCVQAAEVETAEAMAEDGLASAGKTSRPALLTSADATGVPLHVADTQHALDTAFFQKSACLSPPKLGSASAA